MLIADTSSEVPPFKLGKPKQASPWWQGAMLTAMALVLFALITYTLTLYLDAPPIPDTVTGPDGAVLFTGDDIRYGQQVFFKYGLLDKGRGWSSAPNPGPDFLTEASHSLALYGTKLFAQQRFGLPPEKLTPAQRALVEQDVRAELKRNHYDPKTGVLTVGPTFDDWYRNQPKVWKERLSQQMKTDGKPARASRQADELKQLSAFAAWTELAADADQTDGTHAYANLGWQ